VTVRSLMTGDLESVTLLETARDGGIFEGPLPHCPRTQRRMSDLRRVIDARRSSQLARPLQFRIARRSDDHRRPGGLRELHRMHGNASGSEAQHCIAGLDAVPQNLGQERLTHHTALAEAFQRLLGQATQPRVTGQPADRRGDDRPDRWPRPGPGRGPPRGSRRRRARTRTARKRLRRAAEGSSPEPSCRPAQCPSRNRCVSSPKPR